MSFPNAGDRILLVEDSKTLSKLITLKVQSDLSIEIDAAYSMAEAEALTQKNRYTLAILDINLPDAPDGEIVDSMLKKKIPSIVLTGKVDQEFRTKMIQKDIIDYIQKGNIKDIDYVIEIIRRLFKNRSHKVMVVDDSSLIRFHIKTLLENNFFQVFVLAHGEEALEILKQHPDIKIVITDYHMPVMDGLELTREIRKTHTKNQLSIFVISSTSNPEISALFLKQGANDFIHKPFSKEEFSCRITNAIEALENIETITHYASRDFLTGLYNRRYFFTTMEPYFAEALAKNETFVTAMVDIDHFKKINDTYGHDIGDKAIIHLSEILRSSVQHQDIVARFGGEEFCIILKDTTRTTAIDIFERIRQKIVHSPLLLNNYQEIEFTVSIGIALEYENSLTETINAADTMLYQAKNRGRNTIVY